jgi:hypothetical protein
LSRRRRRVLALPPTATAPATTATPAASSSFLSQSQLVIPSSIRIGDRDLEDLLVPVERAVERRIRRILGAEPFDEVIEAEVESRTVAYLHIL